MLSFLGACCFSSPPLPLAPPCSLLIVMYPLSPRQGMWSIRCMTRRMVRLMHDKADGQGHLQMMAHLGSIAMLEIVGTARLLRDATVARSLFQGLYIDSQRPRSFQQYRNQSRRAFVADLQDHKYVRSPWLPCPLRGPTSRLPVCQTLRWSPVVHSPGPCPCFLPVLYAQLDPLVKVKDAGPIRSRLPSRSSMWPIQKPKPSPHSLMCLCIAGTSSVQSPLTSLSRLTLPWIWCCPRPLCISSTLRSTWRNFVLSPFVWYLA